ncbi:MAG: EAL domain-containing protein, partial [Bacillus sp. (in: firmicutes)]
GLFFVQVPENPSNRNAPFKMFEAARVRNRLFSLDRACRLQSVRNASIVGDSLIFINFIPTAIYVPEHCLESTFSLINELDIKPSQVIFEVVETDEVKDMNHLKKILAYYRSHGFRYALDDVGVGYNDVSKLEQLQPDIVKLALEYCNGVSTDPYKQQVAQSVLEKTKKIGATALAEGVEQEEDYHFLRHMGYELFQGYFFSKPTPIPATQENIATKVS